jgi:hypothetical protein
MYINNNVSIAPMDRQTKKWLCECIDSAPDSYSIEWFYELDKDFDSFNYLLNLIVEKGKTL